jgi:hypothetical protein
MDVRAWWDEDEALEAALADLGRSIDEPDGSLATRVLAALDEPVPAAARGSWAGRRRLLVAAAAAVVVAVALSVSAPARRAVADLLELGGIRVNLGGDDDRGDDSGVDPPRAPVGQGLALGRTTTLDAAAIAAGFDVLVPDVDGLDGPDAVYVNVDDRVSLVYEERGGVLVTEFRAPAGAEVMLKEIGPGTTFEEVRVGDRAGWWIAGGRHVVVADGGSRLAANTLIWQRDGITVRLESTLTLDQSLEIAGSMR